MSERSGYGKDFHLSNGEKLCILNHNILFPLVNGHERDSRASGDFAQLVADCNILNI